MPGQTRGRAAVLSLLPALLLCGAVSAAEQRRCDTDFAVFPSAKMEDWAFRLTITLSGKDAKVNVRQSGEWSGRHTRHTNGADTVVFDTGIAIETLTIGPNGELLWEVDYKSKADQDKRVMFFVGMCRPWGGA